MYEVFRKLCEGRGVTPTDVCRATGIASATISSWKSGAYTPKREKLQLIADYFNVPLEYLMTGKMPEGGYSDPETAEIAQAILESKELRGLFLAAKDAPKEDIIQIWNTLLYYKKKEEEGRK